MVFSEVVIGRVLSVRGWRLALPVLLSNCSAPLLTTAGEPFAVRPELSPLKARELATLDRMEAQFPKTTTEETVEAVLKDRLCDGECTPGKRALVADLKRRTGASLQFDPSKAARSRQARAPAAATALRALTIRRESRPFLALRRLRESMRLRPLLDRLRPRDRIVVYHASGGQLTATILGRRDLQQVPLALTGAALAPRIRKIRAVLQTTDRSMRNDWLPLLQQAHRDLVAPLAEHLPAGGRVTFIPSGPLHRLPFAALHDGHQFLIERNEVAVSPLLSLLTHLAERPTFSTPFGPLVLGDPENAPMNSAFDAAFGARFPRLPASVAEARLVGAIAGVKPLIGKEATEDALLAALDDERHSFLHIAAHAKSSTRSPLASFVFLAPGEREDGLLTAAEILEHPQTLDLVVLSSCESAVSGEAGTGLGLHSAFLLAGARAVVASLWSVDDEATARLMRVFYRHALIGRVSASLRAAQLALLKQPELNHPGFWAPFSVYGDVQ